MNYVVSEDLNWLTYSVVGVTVASVVAVIWMLLVKPHILHPVKRFGLSLIGSGLLMGLGTIDGSPTPFAQWTTILARFGVVVLVIGYGLDHHLLPQLRRLNEKTRDCANDKNQVKWNALRSAAWNTNNSERKKQRDDEANDRP